MTSSIASVRTIVDQPRAAQGAQKRGRSRLGFCLFLLVNALLMVRPGELYPPLGRLHLYELSMIGCLLIYWPRLLSALRWSNLRNTPITICVILLLPVVTISILWQSRADLFEEYPLEFLKMVLYYLILVCAIDTPRRLRQFTLFLAAIIVVVGAIAMLNYYEIYQLDSITTLVDRRTSDGVDESINRLQSVGIFQDPNDLAQIMGVGMVLCVYGAELARGWRKLLWAPPMLLMLWGIYLSQSRGGLLGLVAGLAILFVARFGVKSAVITALLVLPPVLAAYGVRQSNIATEDASAQSRVQLWSDSLEALRTHPVLGIGAGAFEGYAGQVSHNSFLQFFAELGFPGGFLFFAAYGVAIWGVLRLRLRRIHVIDDDLAKLTPVLSAALVCYCAGMLSLTRNYVIPTYLMLGMATVYLGIVRTQPAKTHIRWGPGLLGRMFAFSLLYLLAMQVFVKACVRWG